MGIAELVEITATFLKSLHGTPGRTVTAKAKGLGGAGLEAELYQHHGLYSYPPKGARGIFIPLGRGRRYGVILATRDYRVEIDAGDGDTVIYSTSADGATVKAKIYLDAQGNINLNGNTKSLVTYDELNSALSNFLSSLSATMASGANGGGPVAFAVPLPSSINISAARTAKVKTG